MPTEARSRVAKFFAAIDVIDKDTNLSPAGRADQRRKIVRRALLTFRNKACWKMCWARREQRQNAGVVEKALMKRSGPALRRSPRLNWTRRYEIISNIKKMASSSLASSTNISMMSFDAVLFGAFFPERNFE